MLIKDLPILEKLLLIDLSSLVYRYYFIGIKTELYSTSSFIFYSIARDICNLKIKIPHCKIVVILDSKTSSISRKKFYPDYKSGRTQKVAPDIWDQMYVLQGFLSSMNISFLQPRDVEADDLIYYLAKTIEANNLYVFSKDKDLLQIAESPTKDRMYWFIDGDIQNMNQMHEVCRARFAIDIQYLTEYFSIVGDAGDCIPGAKGIGPAFFKKHIGKYHRVVNMLDQYENFTLNEQEKLLRSKNKIKLSKCLFLPRIPNDEYLNGIMILDNHFNIKEVSNFLNSIGWGSLMNIIYEIL